MKAIVTVDLGFGDAGKGRIVDALVRRYNSKLIVRYNGGCQCAHNVINPDNTHHTFCQFGSGMFVPGTRTLLGQHVMVSPTQMLNEAEVLRNHGITGFMDRTYVDERCLITTPFHAAVNRLKELARGNSRHGSCGSGIGETRNFAIQWPSMALYAADLCSRDLYMPKLERMRTMLLVEMNGTLASSGDELAKQMHVLTSPDVLTAVADRFDLFAQCVHIVSADHAWDILRRADIPVFEGAQGVLLDEQHGFAPYHTWSDTTTRHALDMLLTVNYEPFIVGVTRTYATRHGPGPFVTECSALDNTLRDTHNDTNRWQRKFRVGWFDHAMMRYALDATKGVNVLAITHVDQLSKRTAWNMCHHYYTPDNKVFVPHPGDTALTERLFEAVPYCSTVLADKVVDAITAQAGVSCMVTTHGPKAGEEIWNSTMNP